jgi:hypothetical protein
MDMVEIYLFHRINSTIFPVPDHLRPSLIRQTLILTETASPLRGWWTQDAPQRGLEYPISNIDTMNFDQNKKPHHTFLDGGFFNLV